MNEDIDLEALTCTTFDTYNTDGPPERVYKAVSGHPVPTWDENRDEVVKHKWRAATSLAAIEGGKVIVAAVEAGERDPGRLLELLLQKFGCGPWDGFANTTGPNPHALKAIGYSGNVA